MKNKNNNKDEKSASEKEDDTLEVTPEAPGDSNKTGDNSEVQTLSDESNDRVKLDNILTISEDNGNEAPGGSGDDKKNLKPKTKGKRSWWQWSTHPPDPPPTSGAESGANTEKVLEGTPDDHL